MKIFDCRHYLEILSRPIGEEDERLIFLLSCVVELGMHEFAVPLQYLKKSLSLWSLLKGQIVKFKMTKEEKLVSQISDTIVEIATIEERAIHKIIDAVISWENKLD